MKKISFVLASACVVSACSFQYTHNSEAPYLRSHNGKLLMVPPPLSSSNISHFYVLPAQTQNPMVSIEPPRM